MQSQGIILASNPTSWATAFVAIAGLTKLPLLKRTNAVIDMTDLTSPNNWEEMELSLLKRGEEFEFEFNTSETRLTALQVINDSLVVNYYKITLPGWTKFMWFQGLMTALDFGDAQVDSKIGGKFKIKTTGPQYYQTAAPT